MFRLRLNEKRALQKRITELHVYAWLCQTESIFFCDYVSGVYILYGTMCASKITMYGKYTLIVGILYIEVRLIFGTEWIDTVF